MSANNQFSIAVHVMAGLGYRGEDGTTSAQLAASVNTSPSFVRRTLSKLAKAGLVETAKGKGGFSRLARRPDQISLLDIYRAVNAPKAFSIHQYEEIKPCAVSCHIKQALESALEITQQGMERSLGKISLASLLAEIGRH